MADTLSNEEALERLRDIMKDVRICMLTTVENSGELRSRPMAIQDAEFDGDLWFFTNESSPKVDEIQADREVNVAFSEPKAQRYASVSGTATLVNDRQKMEEFWSPAYKAWFPKGLEDPDLALLKVNVRSGELWDAPASGIVYLFGAAKAAITGKSYEPGDHAKVDVESGTATLR
ncbi:general stress protein [bacterium]|nr:MAG: general stress protein [bacterium]